jgi:hypothetical protein
MLKICSRQRPGPSANQVNHAGARSNANDVKGWPALNASLAGAPIHGAPLDCPPSGPFADARAIGVIQTPEGGSATDKLCQKSRALFY